MKSVLDRILIPGRSCRLHDACRTSRVQSQGCLSHNPIHFISFPLKIRALIQIAPATTAHAAKGFWRGLFVIYELFKPLHDVRFVLFFLKIFPNFLIYRSSIGSHEVGMGDRTIPQMVMHMFCATPYLDQVLEKQIQSI